METIIAASLLIFFLYYWIRFPKDGLLVGLIFMSMSTAAFPWESLPFERLSITLQMLFVIMICFIFIAKTLKTGKVSVRLNWGLILMIILSGLMFLYLPVFNIGTYGTDKLIFFIIKGIIPAVAISAYGTFYKKENKIIYITLVIGAFLIAIRVLVNIDAGLYRIRLDEETAALAIARLLGIGSTLILAKIIIEKSITTVRMKLVQWIGFLFLITMMLFTGSRGPTFYVFISVILMLLLVNTGIITRIKETQKIFWISCIVLIAFLVVSYLSNSPSIDRIMAYIPIIGDYFDDSGYADSDYKRIEMLKITWEAILGSKFSGIGTGMFEEIYYRGYKVSYPHNIILEVTLEQGFLGLLVLISILATTIYRIRQLAKNSILDTYGKCLVAVYLFTLLDSMVSGDIGKNYLLWIMTGIIWNQANKPYNHYSMQ